METIKNYLEAMFANMPNTQEVHRAKQELWQMMEDKYTELIGEGKSENEAVGTVISEFGNLEELSEELGLKEEFQQSGQKEELFSCRNITMEEAKDYLHDRATHSFRIALGVLFCILSPVGPILTDAFQVNDGLGIAGLAICIAVAIALFIYSATSMGKWDFLQKENCSIDYATANYVKNEREHYRGVYAIRLTVGIVLCVICWLPVALMDEMKVGIFDLEDFGVVFLFLLVGIGVLLIVQGSKVYSGYTFLLGINDRDTVSGSYGTGQEVEKYKNPVLATIMSVYWITITCIYLIWSFLTFDWYMTWIIWPVAAVLRAVLHAVFTELDR